MPHDYGHLCEKTAEERHQLAQDRRVVLDDDAEIESGEQRKDDIEIHFSLTGHVPPVTEIAPGQHLMLRWRLPFLWFYESSLGIAGRDFPKGYRKVPTRSAMGLPFGREV